MHLVNTTYIVDDRYGARFLDWATRFLIPSLRGIEGVVTVTMSRINHQVEPGTTGYAVQVRVSDTAVHEKWSGSVYGAVRTQLDCPGDSVLEFTTSMDILAHHDIGK